MLGISAQIQAARKDSLATARTDDAIFLGADRTEPLARPITSGNAGRRTVEAPRMSVVRKQCPTGKAHPRSGPAGHWTIVARLRAGILRITHDLAAHAPEDSWLGAKSA